MSRSDIYSRSHEKYSFKVVIERSHLVIVREVDQQGSLTSASRRLHLTQSALSHSMRKLERELGAPIWQREGRKLRLTQAGQQLLSLANRLLPQFESAESAMHQYARGTRGTLRIGMECHPCYQWLLKTVARYLPQWPDVDVDVKQKFRFGGIGALLDHEIDLVVTPDPEKRAGLLFVPVFDYEQVLVVARSHRLAGLQFVEPKQLADEVLITYPVDAGRLDIYSLFLTPAGIAPRSHKTIESTDLILQMVAAGRGVAALPRWLVEEQGAHLPVVPVRLGRKGVPKHIHLGLRAAEKDIGYLRAFINTAQGA
jgi:LysR family transcriptional regulator for metE and metH